jgi:hypothetical protein
LIGSLQKGHVYYRCQTRSCPTTCLREENITEQLDRALASLKLDSLDLDLLNEECRSLFTDFVAEQEEEVKALHLNVAQIDERVARLTDAYIDRVIDKELFEARKAKLFEERLSMREKISNLSLGESHIDTKLNNFLEPLKSLGNKNNLANPEEKRDFVKTATSNLVADQKNLVYSWRSPFTVLAARQETSYGAPHRGTSRTLHHQITKPIQPQAVKSDLDNNFYKKLAKTVVGNLPPLPDSIKEDVLENERLKKYARQIKMVGRWNRKRE